MTKYSRSECLTALRAAAQELGRAPSRREYTDLDYGPSPSAIRSKFGSWNEAKEEAGLEINRGGRRPMSVKTEYFHRIDTISKAYWLGYLYGDGSMIVRNEETGKFSVQLTTSENDVDHLRRYKRAVESENAMIEDGSERHLRIGDQEFAENLYDKGMTETKSTDDSLPELSSWELRRAFVRGLADADGYFGRKKWTITDATDRRLKRLRRWIPVELDVVHENYGDRSWVYLRTSRSHRLVALYGWLFPRREQTEPAMPRKKEVALSVLERA